MYARRGTEVRSSLDLQSRYFRLRGESRGLDGFARAGLLVVAQCMGLDGGYIALPAVVRCDGGEGRCDYVMNVCSDYWFRQMLPPLDPSEWLVGM